MLFTITVDIWFHEPGSGIEAREITSTLWDYPEHPDDVILRTGFVQRFFNNQGQLSVPKA